MWIFTSAGILMPADLPEAFRLSEHTHLDMQVRARDRDVLEKLVVDLKAQNEGWDVVGPIMDTGHMDYEWRVYVDRDAFGVWVSRQVINIDYTKFKPTTMRPGGGGQLLHHVYVAVWHAIASLYGSPVLDATPKRAKRSSRKAA